jgi:predicted Zn-dependent protease
LEPYCLSPLEIGKKMLMIIRNSRPRLGIFLLIGLLISPTGWAASIGGNLPDLGDESAAVLTPQDERRIGEDFMRQARQQLDLLDDPELNDYVKDLGRRLTAGVDGLPAFHFFLVNNSSINAFAVPGGYIGVHTGLLLAARSEAELAAVLAHETAHITQRHMPRMIAESQRLSGPALAAMLAGILIAASGQPGGAAAVMMTQAGLAQNEINFTRSFEEEADRIGMNILNNAGYDARAMPDFFEQMELLTRLYDNNLPEFLRTHPVTGRRIAESRNHAGNFPVRTNPDTNAFANMQARLQVLGNKPDEALKIFQAKLANRDSAHATADQYGLALALLMNKRYEEARKESALLLKARADYVPYYILRAEIELAANNTSAGLKAYAEASRKFPTSLALTQHYASALLKNNQPAQARQLLDKAVRARPEEPALYQLLASAAGKSGNRMEAHRAYGEYYFLTGQPRAAIEQFELATRFAENNFYYISSLEARIKDIRETLPPAPATKQPERDGRSPPAKNK